MVDCPTDFELERFVAGRATSVETALIERHRADCAACRSWLAEARADEALVPRLRTAGSGPGGRGLSEGLGGLGDAEDEEPALARYKILRRIGSGGMGVVYEAEQRNPRRAVALKVLRPALVSERALERFADEARLLARLDHPGIARIFEAGTYTSRGEARPFFALELVDGRSLTSHADHAGLDVRARVALFVRVCGAVQHAHQKGVVHRDLKPTNVLVTAEGHPKILDFGVAQAIEDDAERPAMADRIEVVGTLAYMSPEQLAGDASSVDTRSDVFALGACLFELLAGRPSIEARGLSAAEFAGRLSRSEPPALTDVRSDVSRDLAAIAARALARDPDARYPSAAALADDLMRYLSDEEVSARRPGSLERAARTVRKHRAWVGGLVLAFVTLLGGMVTTYGQARRARAAEAVALAEAATVEEVNVFLQRLLGFDAADPVGTPRDEDATFGEILAEAEATLDGTPLSDGETEARFRVAIGNAWRLFGRHERAVRNLRRALSLREERFGLRDLSVAESSNTLGVALLSQGATDDALECFDRALAIYAELDRPEHEPLIATTRSNVAGVLVEQGRYTEADEHLEAALVLHERHLGATSMHVANDLCILGVSQARQERFADAVASLRASLEAARRGGHADHPLADGAALRLIIALCDRARWSEAEPLAHELVEMRRSAHGDASPRLAEALVYVARTELFQERIAPALANAERAVAILHERADADPLLLHDALLVFGQAAHADGDTVTGGALLRQAADLPGLPAWVRSRSQSALGALWVELGRDEEAVPMLEAAIEGLGSFPGTWSHIARAHLNLSDIWRRRGEWEDAVHALEAALDELEPDSESGPFEVLANAAGRRLGQVLSWLERCDEARPWLERLHAASAVSDGPEASATLILRTDLATCLLAQGQVEAARAHFEAVSARTDDRLLELRARCGLLRATGDADQAQRLDARCRELMAAGELPLPTALVLVATELERVGWSDQAAHWCALGRAAVLTPPRDPRAVSTLGPYARRLIETGRFVEAEDVLLEALALLEEDGLRDAAAPMRGLITIAIELYEAWDRPSWAAEQRARLRSTGG